MLFVTARVGSDMHIGNASFDTSWQSAAFGLSILAILCLGALLIWIKTDILKIKADLEEGLMN
jgi:hypothetical protein